jgi:glucose/mannose transport system substrate-binding protein
MSRRLLSAVAAFAMAAAAPTLGRAAESVEVLHWWTSGGEAAALNVLKQNLQKEGVGWQDMPVAGGSGVQAMTALRARVASGKPPTAVQLLGFDITDWAEQGQLADISSVAAKEGWDKVIPAALQAFAKYDGKWIAAPVNVHSTNWLWINKGLLDKVGGGEPKSFDELIALLDKFKAAGVVPLAHGGQPWQDATIFENVVLTTGGPDFYKQAMLKQDPAALGSSTMKTVFDRMTKLRGYFDPNFSGRDWNLSSAMVINGQAGAQIMGDWAKGEFLNAGKKPGVDFVCIRFPGTQGNVTFNSDQFAAFKVGQDQQDAQFKLVSAVEDPAFQSSFNVVKGSVPARVDVPDTAFDACGKKGMADLKEASAKGTLMGSLAHGYGGPAAVKQAFFDVVTKQLNGQLTSDQAIKELVDAVKNAK